MSYEENKQINGLDQAELVNDNSLFVIANNGKALKVKRSELGLVKMLEYEFEIADWASVGDTYTLNVNHQLGGYGIIEIYHGDQIVGVKAQRVDDNNILLTVPVDPDLRFDGRIIIHK